MGIDTLALMIAKAPVKARTEALVMKELGVSQSDASKQNQFTNNYSKDNQLYVQIQQRIAAGALPFLNA